MIVVSRDNVQAFSEISGIITMFYVVRTLSPYTEYEFYVIAVNNIGRGPPSLPATTTTGETGIQVLGIPQNMPIMFIMVDGILLLFYKHDHLTHAYLPTVYNQTNHITYKSYYPPQKSP